MVQRGAPSSSKGKLIPVSPEDLAKLAQASLVVPPGPVAILGVPARSLKRRLSVKQRKEIQARVAAGETRKALAEEFGISLSGLDNMLLNLQVDVCKTQITPEHEDKAVELYKSGMSVHQVMAELRYSVGTIQRVLRKRGVTMRVKGVDQ